TPRIRETPIQGGVVVTIAIPPAASIPVPAFEAGRPSTCYVRFGPNTYEAPEHLVALLALGGGRRHRPVYNVELVGLNVQVGRERRVAVTDGRFNADSCPALAHLRVENASLIHARDVRVGLIGYGVPNQKQRPLASSLLESVELLGAAPLPGGANPWE